jgi:hypothetical protein
MASEFSTDDVFSEMVAVYEQARDRLGLIHEAWLRADCPLTTEGSMGQTIEHPVVKLLRETEIEVLRLGDSIRRQKRRGREPEAVIKSKLRAAPSSGKLREVKSA